MNKVHPDRHQALRAQVQHDDSAPLRVAPSRLKELCWSQPPGSQRVLYWRPTDCLEVSPAVQTRRRSDSPVAAVLLALSTPSGNTHALPRVLRTLPQAELVHQGLVSQLNRLGGAEQARELLGVDAERKPLAGHWHTHVLPLDLDSDGHLDHVLLWTPGGLGDMSQRAAQALQKTYAKGIGELRVGVVAMGDLADLEGLMPPYGPTIAHVLQQDTGATHWRSITPLVLPRFLKQSGKNGFEGQVHAELASRGLPTARVEVVARRQLSDQDDANRSFRHFVLVRDTRRKGGPSVPPPVAMGHDVRLVFDAPVRGPVTLGYGSHFGLGLFGGERA